MIKPLITYRGPLDQKVKGFSGEMKRLLQFAVKMWHSDMLPRHFDTYSKLNSRYPNVYKARTKRYMIRKGIVTKHQRLLEFTGTTKRSVTSSITISGTSRKVRGRMFGANRAINFAGRQGMPDMRDEITALSQGEAEYLATWIDKEAAKFLNNTSVTKTVNP